MSKTRKYYKVRKHFCYVTNRRHQGVCKCNCYNCNSARPNTCYDCGINTVKIYEYPYMVSDKLWKLSHVPKLAMLCVEHLEKRIKRKLEPGDFPKLDSMLDNGWKYSERLQERIGYIG